MSPKRRRVDSPSRGPLTRSQIGKKVMTLITAGVVRPSLPEGISSTAPHTRQYGHGWPVSCLDDLHRMEYFSRLPVAQTSLRHGMKDVTIKMATVGFFQSCSPAMVVTQGPHEDQENLPPPPPNVNRSSMGSLESVCLSDGKEGGWVVISSPQKGGRCLCSSEPWR